ncbi:hypothetical protein UFOVP23_51, partial [uncultured Caudovirales phage]
MESEGVKQMSKKEDKHEKMKRLGKEAMTGPRVVGKMVKE